MTVSTSDALTVAQARDLEAALLRTARALHHSAQQARVFCEQRQAQSTGTPESATWDLQVRRWRRTTEQALEVVRDWEYNDEPAVARDEEWVGAVDSATSNLVDIVIKALFSTGLELHAVMSMSPPHIAERLAHVVEGIDLCIREIRYVVIDLQG